MKDREEYACETCAKEREKAKQDYRILYEIPRECLADSFEVNAPAFLCYYCDGDAYQMAKVKHGEIA
jgi:hypothetical protein